MADEINGTPFYMPVAPAGGNGFGGFGGADGGMWLILLFILLLGGNGFGGGFGGNNGLYPWMNQTEQINNGFRDQAIGANIGNVSNGITSGFGDIQTALCGGFAGVNASIANANTADLERSFAAQTAVTSGFASLQAQLAECCCRNNLATVQTQNIVQSEGAATRLAIQNQTQQILDKMCQQEIDALKAQNLSLQNQLNIANLAASQTAQSQYLIDKLAPAAL
jgi:hypothetical protein